MTLSFLLSWIARGAVVLAVALVASRLVRRAPAALRFMVVAAALAAVLALPMIGAVVPAWHTGAIAAQAPNVEPPAVPIAETAVPAIATTYRVSAAPAPVPAPSPFPWATLALVVWALGAVGVLARFAAGAWRARRIAARARPATGIDAHVTAAWRAVAGRGAPPRVVVSTEIDAPIAVGAVAGVIAVPRASSAWSAERWRVVLVHELAHVRRRDGLANLVAQLACAVHWIDPLAWIAARRMRGERELAADDAVLRGGARASTYAEHLVAIAAGATRDLPAAAMAMAEPSRFEARVVALLDAARPRGAAGVRRSLAVVTAIAAVATLVACVSPDGAAPRDHATATATATAAAAPTTTVAPATDTDLQAAAEQELDRAIADTHAAGAVAIVLDAKTGAVLALAGRGDGDPRALRPPGSTMKPFTFAAALDAGVIEPTTKVDCGGGSRKYGDQVITDADPHGVLDLGAVLAVSSNVCTAVLAEPLGDRLADALRRYHFAAPAHLDTKSFEGAAIGSGEGIRASALDVAAAYTALADGGLYHAPDGGDGVGERVMTEATARTVLGLLERVVTDRDGTGGAARIEGVRVAGKTGTVNASTAGTTYASFVGIVPADAPAYVVLVGVDGTTASGGKVAAPVFAKLAARALGR